MKDLMILKLDMIDMMILSNIFENLIWLYMEFLNMKKKFY